MEKIKLLELGFIDTSYIEEGVDFTEFTLQKENFKIEISGLDSVEIFFTTLGWIDVPNCNNIEDLKKLISLFTKK